MVASWILWTRQADEVWFVPVANHAIKKGLSPFHRRIRWCQILADVIGEHGVQVSDIEAHLPFPSYTIQTLEHLSKDHPYHKFRLVVGTDVLTESDQWHRWDDIVANFDPIVVGRGGHGSVPGAPTFPEVSSSQIRVLLAKGSKKDVEALVPAEVLWEMEDGLEEGSFWDREA